MTCLLQYRDFRASNRWTSSSSFSLSFQAQRFLLFLALLSIPGESILMACFSVPQWTISLLVAVVTILVAASERQTIRVAHLSYAWVQD
jgi:hypothetical protein